MAKAATTTVATLPVSYPPSHSTQNRDSSTPPSVNGEEAVARGERGAAGGAVEAGAGTRGEDSPRFKFSKLLQLHQHNHQNHPSVPEQNEVQPPLSPRQQSQKQHSQHHHQGHQHGFLSSKHPNPTSGFRRVSFFGFLQSHYHVFHRQHGQGESQEQKDDVAVSSFARDNHSRRNSTAVPPRSPVRSVISSLHMNRGSCGSAGNNGSGHCHDTDPGSKSSHATVHSGYNVTVSDFRTHATIASDQSATLPTKVTDIVYDGTAARAHRQLQQEQLRLQQAHSSSSTTLTPTAALAEAVTVPTRADGKSRLTENVVSVTTTLTSSDRISSLPALQGASRASGNGLRASLRSIGLFSNRKAASPNRSTAVSSPALSTVSTATIVPSRGSRPSSQRSEQYGEPGQQQDLVKEHPPPSLPSSSPKHLSKVLEAGAKRIGLIKKKKPMPSHYLSLPVGGTASAVANGMYMLHSEDLSVTEFAKLAGITILPEVEDDDYYTFSLGASGDNNATATSEDPSTTSSESSRARTTAHGSGSAGNTFDSDKHLTSGSIISDRSLLQRANIWDPQFWVNPSGSAASQTAVAPSASTSSLPIIPASVSTPASPTLSPLVHLATIPELQTQPSRALETEQEPQWLQSRSSIQARRYSCSPCELRPGAGSSSGFKSDRTCASSSSNVSLKRVDEMSYPPKEAVELSRSLSRRRSFTSLTAIAIELGQEQDQDEVQERDAVTEGFRSKNITPLRQDYDPAAASSFVPALVPTPPAPHTIHVEPTSDPAAGQSGSATRLQHHLAAHSVALHALQPSRSKDSLLTSGSLSRSPPHSSGRARSPSPSPLSRQLELDSPQDEQDEFDFGEATLAVPASSLSKTTAAARSAPLSTRLIRPLKARSPRYAVVHEHGEKDVQGDFGSGSDRGLPTAPKSPPNAGLMYHHQTQSMPMLLAARSSQRYPRHAHHHHHGLSLPPSFSASMPPSHSPPPSQPVTTSSPRRPSSSPGRTFAPGTKVGRFTLVQELCTKHVDVLKAQEEQQQQQLLSQRRASIGDLRGAAAASRVISQSGMDPQARATGGDSAFEGPVSEWAIINPTLKPEDNVVIFQRKKIRRLQQLQA